MDKTITEDLAEIAKKLSEYLDKGQMIGYQEIREEPPIMVKPDKSKIKPLKKMERYQGHFLAVDCSTRTLKRAHNWGIYLLRVTIAVVKGRDVDWGYREKIYTAIGDSSVRYRLLGDARVELESEMALDALSRRKIYDGDFLLLDGPSYFGGKRKFRVALYEKCRKEEINLLAISKQSPTLHDEKGRDLIAATCMLSPYSMWVYHPITTANTDKHLYGNVSLVKLCESSSRVFRCDIMKYLSTYSVDELISPLTSISEDPRCLGYPVALWLAHDFSVPSNSKLLYYHDLIEETLAEAGLLDILRMEELSCNFGDELHGVRHPFEWEWVEHV
jgi:hypothetical protein